MTMMTATQRLDFAAANGIPVNTIKTFRNGDVLVSVEIEGEVTKIRIPKHMVAKKEAQA